MKNRSVIAVLSDQLRRDISLGLIKPGERLNIEAVKRAYGVSHPSVREALSLLVGEGYVAFRESKGFRALESSQEEQRDFIRVRAELECVAIDWSIKQSTVDWRAKVVAAHYALSEIEREMLNDPTNTVLEWDERNRTFHFALVGNCGSPKLLEIIASQYDLSRRYRLMAHASNRSRRSRLLWLENSANEHKLLKQAVLQGDVDLGQKVLKKHITKAALHVIDGTSSANER